MQRGSIWLEACSKIWCGTPLPARLRTPYSCLIAPACLQGFHEAWEVGTRRRHRLHRDWAVLCAAVHNGKTVRHTSCTIPGRVNKPGSTSRVCVSADGGATAAPACGCRQCRPTRDRYGGAGVIISSSSICTSGACPDPTGCRGEAHLASLCPPASCIRDVSGLCASQHSQTLTAAAARL